MDSVIFQAMAAELNRLLANSRVDRVIQVTAGTLVLKLWTGAEKCQLLLKADGRGSFYLSRQAFAAPAQPPRFCQLLRARLRRMLAVRAEPLDRIVYFEFIGPGKESYRLVLEGFGAQGNLILVDADGRIVDLLRREAGRRTLLPGQPYTLPEQKPRLSLFEGTGELVELLSQAGDELAMARLAVAPMSAALARAICRARSDGMSLTEIVGIIHDAFGAADFQASRVDWDGGSGLLPLALGMSAFNRVQQVPDLSRLLDEDSTEQRQEEPRDLRARLLGVVAGQRKKLGKRLARIAEEQQDQSDPEQLRIRGDLLLANLHRIKRGSNSIEVEDYYQSPPTRLTIALDGKLSPQENAERLFKSYRKAKRAGHHHLRRIRETEQELAWLAEVELALDEAESGDDLYHVQQELASAGLLKTTRGQLGRRRTAPAQEQLHQAETPGGLKVFWGRNSRTNDYVSRHLTAAGDLWFHAQAMPGCHLVLKCAAAAGQVPEEEVLFAASLAAGYSRGRSAGKVEVIVARGRDVQKPRGARPGLVTVDAYRTVMVVPRRLDD